MKSQLTDSFFTFFFNKQAIVFLFKTPYYSILTGILIYCFTIVQLPIHVFYLLHLHSTYKLISFNE